MLLSLRDSFATRIRQKNSIYLAISLFARVLNALGMFLALQRFSPSTFGEMSYLQATAVSTVAFCAFGIDMSINAELTRKQQQGSPLGPTVLAGCTLALTGIILASIVVSIGFAAQLRVAGSPGLAILAVCLYASFLILTSLLSAMSFALRASINVGIAYLLTSVIFVLFAIFGRRGVSGVDLMFFLIVAQVVAVSFIGITLTKRASAPEVRHFTRYLARHIVDTKVEIKRLVAYGVKQAFVVSVITFSLWLIQRKIVFGEGGASENAIYSVGNQIFAMMLFIPTMLAPIIVTRLASAGSDIQLRRRISLRSLRLFGGIAAGACVAVFIGLRIGIPFLPPRYAAAVGTGLIASFAAVFQIMKSPFSLYFLSELKASREIVSSVAGALFMIIAVELSNQLSPNEGTMIRLLGCALQAGLLCLFFLFETRPTAPPS